MTLIRLSGLLACALAVSAQTQLNLKSQAKGVDFRSMSFTSPISLASSLPATCSVGNLVLLSTAPAGQNIYACTSTNTWTLQAGGGGLPDPGVNGLVLRTAANTTSSVAAPVGAVLGTTDTQTVTNKSIAASQINSGTLPNSVMPMPTTSALGGVKAFTATSQRFLTSISTSGSVLAAQPAFTDLAGSLSVAQLPALTGDVAASPGTGLTVLATVNGAPGTFGDSTHCPTFTVNGKGLITAASQSTSCPGGGSSGSGNATQIQSVAVAGTAPTNNSTLVYTSGAAAYTPTVLYTLGAGLGTTVAGSTNLSVSVSNGTRAIVTASSDTIQPTDCGGLVEYNNASGVSVGLPQPSLGGNFLSGCPIQFRDYGAGSLTITPSGSSIGTAASGTAVTVTTGCFLISDGSNWRKGAYCN